MAGDDILWKNVEAMKEHPPSDSQDALRRSQSRAQRDRRIDAVSPSVSENEDRSGSMSATPETVPDMDVSQAGNYSDRTMPSDRPYGRTRVRPANQQFIVPGRPARRRPERYAFQFWSDQITRLKRLRQVLNMAKDPDDRDDITLADLAREAFDEYLDRQTQMIRTYDRTDA